MRIVRKAFRVVFILAVLVLAGAVALFFWLRTSLPRIEGDVAVEGLGDDVEILRDEWGIPHIFAQSPRDAYFGLGFAHAQDRFFQMEMQRRGAQGSISELLGSLALERDRFLRLLDLYRASRSSFATLSPETRETLEAYAAGVNAWLATRDGPAAPELALLLADHPESWHPADSVSWLKIMALLLAGNWREEALHAAVAERLGPEKAASFFPAFPQDSPAILEAAQGIDFTALSFLFDRLLGTPGKGSNNWAVSGKHTASGYPLLANDPHLGYAIPSVWYLAHLEAPGFSVAGATLPGMPLVVIGTNGRIAWSLSNTGPDTQDLFIERRDPDDADRYLAPDGPEPFAVREETIVVRFGTDEQITMLETRHGPVLTGIVDRLPGDADDEEVLSLAWTMLHDDDRSMESALALHTAQNWQDFTAIARFYAGPMQNIIYADRDGNIGLLAPGFVPVRRSGDGRLPVEGWTGESDWLGRIPLHDLPRTFDPPSGILAAANNRLVGENYPYFLSHRWEPGYRADRIREVLGSHSRHDLESFTRLQLDNRSGLVEAFLGHALSGEPQTVAGRLLQVHLEAWDLAMDTDLVAPTIFHAWYREFTRSIYEDEMGELFETAWWHRPEFVLGLLNDDSHGWCSNAETGESESCSELAVAALDKAAVFLREKFGGDPADWVWGKAHALDIRHPLFGFVPVLDDLTGVSLPLGGDRHSVAAADYAFSSDSRVFTTVHGPALRAVIDLEEPVTGHFIIMPGQSGNPFSPFYDNMTERWNANRPLAIVLGREMTGAATRLVLTSGNE